MVVRMTSIDRDSKSHYDLTGINETATHPIGRNGDYNLRNSSVVVSLD